MDVAGLEVTVYADTVKCAAIGLVAHIFQPGEKRLTPLGVDSDSPSSEIWKVRVFGVVAPGVHFDPGGVLGVARKTVVFDLTGPAASGLTVSEAGPRNGALSAADTHTEPKGSLGVLCVFVGVTE